MSACVCVYTANSFCFCQGGGGVCGRISSINKVQITLIFDPKEVGYTIGTGLHSDTCTPMAVHPSRPVDSSLA